MKSAIFFLCGALVSAVAVILAGGRPTVFLAMGFVLALGCIAAIVRLLGIARTIRVLEALSSPAAGVEKSKSPRAGMRNEAKLKVISGKDKNPWSWVQPSPKQQNQILEDTIEEYLEDRKGAGRVQ